MVGFGFRLKVRFRSASYHSGDQQLSGTLSIEIAEAKGQTKLLKHILRSLLVSPLFTFLWPKQVI